ncbi:hypothetical protein [Anaplasma phagocytophilum]|uniref:hypothetical protein n=1 Tax=Anaplasma phagocytophilum TaxID=948 RepID=UPI003977C2EA
MCWPNSSNTSATANATTVPTDLVKALTPTPEEKNIVAGLIAKTIEGGEVFEILGQFLLPMV